MKKILLDTNFLLSQFEYGVDIWAELGRIVNGPFTLLIPNGVLDEISTLAGRTGRRAASARFVLQNIPMVQSRFKIEKVQSSGAVDAWIIKFAHENPVCVATNDIPLRKRLLSHGVVVIAVKGKSKLDFV